MTKLRSRMVPFFGLFFSLLWASSGLAQTPKEFTTYAASDYADYQKSTFANPQWDPFVKEGFDALDKGDLDTTLEFLKKAVNRGCASPLVYMKMALSFEGQGSYYSAIQFYEMAEESFKKANQNHRYASDFKANYGRALYLMGQKDKAIPILEQAAATANHPWILKLLGEVYTEKGDHQQATAYFERLLKDPQHGLTPPEVLDINLLLARAYRKQNAAEGALRYYENVLQMDPAHKEASDYVKQTKDTKNQNENWEDVLNKITEF